MGLRRFVGRAALRVVLAGFVLGAVSGCADISFPGFGKVFSEDHARGPVKRDELGNPILPKN